jgi:cell division protein FtsB
MIKKIWNKLPEWIKNRYILTLFAFALWMLFFDQNDMINQYKLKSQLNNLIKEKNYYEEQIRSTNQELQNLLNDNEKLERFARERYLMKRNNEEIFVIVSE